MVFGESSVVKTFGAVSFPCSALAALLKDDHVAAFLTHLYHITARHSIAERQVVCSGLTALTSFLGQF